MSNDEDKILTTKDVAKKFKVAPGTVSNWVGGTKPDFPKGFKIGTGRNASRRWRESVLDKYIAECERIAA